MAEHDTITRPDAPIEADGGAGQDGNGSREVHDETVLTPHRTEDASEATTGDMAAAAAVAAGSPSPAPARTRGPGQYLVFQKADPTVESSLVPPERIVGWFRLLTSEPITADNRGEAIKAATEGFTLQDANGEFFVPRAKDVTLIPRQLKQTLHDSLDEPRRR